MVTASLLGLGVHAVAATPKPSATKRYCNAFKANSMLVQQSFLGGSSGEAATALKAKIDAGVAAAKAVVPAAIADEYDVVTSDSSTDLTAVADAQQAIDTWVLAHCRYEVVKVAADDSSVKMPKTLKPGFVAFVMTNSGTMARFYGVVPLAAGQTAAQLVAASSDQLRPFLIAEALTLPGQEAVGYGPITKPGTYVVIDGNSVGTPQPSYTTFTVKK